MGMREPHFQAGRQGSMQRLLGQLRSAVWNARKNQPPRRRLVLECEGMEERLLLATGLLATSVAPLTTTATVAPTTGLVAPIGPAVNVDSLPKSVTDGLMGLPL